MAQLEASDPAAWEAFQHEVQTLKLKRSELETRVESLEAAIQNASAASAYELELDVTEAGADEAAKRWLERSQRESPVNVVLVTGFESFNQLLYRKAAQQACAHQCFCFHFFLWFGDI